MSLYRSDNNPPANLAPVERSITGSEPRGWWQLPRVVPSWLVAAPARIAGVIAWEAGRAAGAAVRLITGHAPHTDLLAQLTWESSVPVEAAAWRRRA